MVDLVVLSAPWKLFQLSRFCGAAWNGPEAKRSYKLVSSHCCWIEGVLSVLGPGHDYGPLDFISATVDVFECHCSWTEWAWRVAGDASV